MLHKDDFKITVPLNTGGAEMFEGPLDLLLSLIEKRKLLINDVSLAQVTDDYIVYVKSLEKFSINKTAHFILIASTLLLLKSRSLLPSMELSQEEESDISDLELRLRLYQKYKEASLHIEEMFGTKIMHNKEESKRQKDVVFAPSKQITLETMYASVKNIIKTLPKVEKVPEAIIKKVISLEEMITKLTNRIQSKIKMSFKEFSGELSQKDARQVKIEKIDIIVSFLAMLELVRQDVLKVEQQEKYSDINMETNSISVPKYN